MKKTTKRVDLQEKVVRVYQVLDEEAREHTADIDAKIAALRKSVDLLLKRSDQEGIAGTVIDAGFCQALHGAVFQECLDDRNLLVAMLALDKSFNEQNFEDAMLYIRRKLFAAMSDDDDE